MTFKRPTLKKLVAAIKDRNGSEIVELVYSTAALCAMIMSALLIMGYAFQANSLAYAGKRIARYVEVSGVADPTDLDYLLHELLPNADDINARVNVTMAGGDTWFSAASRKIQLRDQFTVTITGDYYVKLINPADYSEYNNNGIPIPIRCVVNGQSEIYHKS